MTNYNKVLEEYLFLSNTKGYFDPWCQKHHSELKKTKLATFDKSCDLERLGNRLYNDGWTTCF